MKKIIGLTALGLAVTACGGGGGGGNGTVTPPPVAITPEVKVLSSTVTRYAAQSSAISFEVQIKPNFTPAGTLSVSASDKAGVIQSQVAVAPGTDGGYVLSFDTAAGAAAGYYTGDIVLKLCADQACATPQAVASVNVPYDLTVATTGGAWPATA